MRKNGFKKMVAGVLVTANLLTSVALAKTEQIDNNKVVVSGDAGEGQTTYVVGVFYPEKSATDALSFRETELVGNDILVYYKQGKTDENGEWSVEFNMSGTSAEYPVYVYSDETKTIDSTQKVWYRDADEFKTVIEELNVIAADDTKSETDFISHATATTPVNNAIKLGFVCESPVVSNNNEALKILYNETKLNPLVSTNITSAVEKYRQACVVSELNAGNIANIFDYSEIFADAVTNLSGYLTSEDENAYILGDEIKSKISTYVKSLNVTNVEAFLEGIAVGTVLKAAEGPIGVEDLAAIMNSFSYATNLSASGYSQGKIQSAIGGQYNTVDELKSALDGSGSDDGDGDSDGGSISGNGSSGGGAGSSSITVEGLEPENNGAEAIPVDVFSDLDNVLWARNAIVGLTDRGIIKGKTENTFAPNENILREEFVKIMVLAFAKDSETKPAVFKDVKPNDWYYEVVLQAVAAGLVKGHSEELFGAGEMITRQDLAVMLYRAAFSDVAIPQSDTEPFADFSEVSDYAKDAVMVLSQKRIINGFDDKTFRPNATATRAEAAKMVYEALK